MQSPDSPPINLPLLLGLGSAFCSAVAHALGPRATGGRPPEEITGIAFWLMGALLLAVLLAFPQMIHINLSALGAGLLLLIVVIDSVGNLLLFKCYRQSHPTVATPLLSLAPAFAFPVAWLAPLPQQLSLSHVALGYGATLLVVLVAMDWKNLRHFQQVTFWPAILSSACFGLTAVPVRFLLREWGQMNAPSLYMVRAFLIAIIITAIWRHKALPRLPFSHIKIIALRGGFVIGQYLLLYKALTLTAVGIALTTANLAPAMVVFGSILFCRERWSWKKMIPAVLAVVAALLM